MKLTGYGKREWLGGGIVVIISITILIICTRYNQALFTALALLTGIIYLAVLWLFRDPERKVPEESNVLVSPADGTICDIELIKDTEENQYFEGKDAVRIGIKISMLDVHIERMPCDLTVQEKFTCRDCFYNSKHIIAHAYTHREAPHIHFSNND